MSRVIVLDTGPIGLITNPNLSEQSIACNVWLQRHLRSQSRIVVPEIADYEVRRELIRARKEEGLNRLDTLSQIVEYQPLTTASMRVAAKLWARARQTGQPTAGDNTIDGDMILIAQAMSLDTGAIIATTNVKHLSRFVSADEWQTIEPD